MLINNLAKFKQKTIKGGITLFFRQGIFHSINILGNIILARILIPEDFGVYAIILLSVNILILLGDVGLGASLIQCSNEPALDDYRSVFSFQQLLVIALLFISFAFSPLIVNHFHLKSDTLWMIRLMSFSAIFASFRGISAVQLERHLEFSKLAFVEIIEASFFQGVAIVLALLGMGVWSFIVGYIVKSVLGAIIVFFISPWKVRWHWNIGKVKSLSKFGLPYQGVTIISLIKDSINPVLIGTLIGTTAVGYVNWSNMLASYPVLVVNVFSRLFFPAFSRINQDQDKEVLKNVAEKMLRWNNMLVFGLLAILISQAHEITQTIFGAKWLPALPLVYLFSFGDIFIASCSPSLALINALGRSKVAFTFAVIWMASTWILGYPLIKMFGFIGYGYAHLLMQISNFALFQKVKKLVPLRFIPSIYPSFVAFLLAFFLTYTVKKFIHNPSVRSLFLLGILTIITYIGGIMILDGKVVLREGLSIIRAGLQHA